MGDRVKCKSALPIFFFADWPQRIAGTSSSLNVLFEISAHYVVSCRRHWLCSAFGCARFAPATSRVVGTGNGHGPARKSKGRCRQSGGSVLLQEVITASQQQVVIGVPTFVNVDMHDVGALTAVWWSFWQSEVETRWSFSPSSVLCFWAVSPLFRGLSGCCPSVELGTQAPNTLARPHTSVEGDLVVESRPIFWLLLSKGQGSFHPTSVSWHVFGLGTGL